MSDESMSWEDQFYEAEENWNKALAKVEQLRVQLAGCGVAANGGVEDPAQEGSYGWSRSYHDVLDLRRKYGMLIEGLGQRGVSRAHGFPGPLPTPTEALYGEEAT